VVAESGGALFRSQALEVNGILPPMLANIVLVGFMGSGKTSVGRNLASLTGHRFLDTDEIISTGQNASITEIFARLGEEGFRDLETRCLQDLVGVCGVILATGGGIILRPENRDLLHQIGAVAWLDADPDVLFERVSRNRKRPLLATEDPRATFDTLRSNRLAIYEETADFRVDSTGLTHLQAARRVMDLTARGMRRA
jgi:shikimate kinase